MKLLIASISYIFAVVLGIYGQSLAYYFHDIFDKIEPFPYLIVISILSFVLYIFSILYYLIICKKAYKLPHEIIIFIALLLALPVMAWTFIVCMFWWG